jgi:hypothetical protein
LFNPASIAALLRRLGSPEPYSIKDLFFADGRWCSWDHHGRFSASSPEESLALMNAGLEQGAAAFKNCDVLVLTFGTAFVYRLVKNGNIVANCHKQPQNLFTRELLSVAEIVDEYTRVFNNVNDLRPDTRCIMTISPVRHLRDDPHENLVSKSTLACAVHELEKAFPRLYYFPAYEIMMDELRDYRFYEKDMAHPNEVAVDYLWDRFVDACVDEKSRQFIGEYEQIWSAMAHRISQPGDAAKEFARAQLEKVHELAKRYPEADLGPAAEYFAGFKTPPAP